VLRHRQPLTTAITPRSIGRRCGRSPGPGSAVRHERPARRAHRLPDHPAHALGYKLERTEKLLCQFLDYLDEHELERVTTGRRSAWTAPTSTSTTASSPCARASSASRGSCRCTPRLWRRSTATSAAAIGCARRQRAKPCSSLASAAACSTATSTGRSCGSSSAPACGPARPPAGPACTTCATASRSAPCSTGTGQASTCRRGCGSFPPTWGHVDPEATYWYLSAAPELLTLAGERLERAHGAAHEHARPRPRGPSSATASCGNATPARTRSPPTATPCDCCSPTPSGSSASSPAGSRSPTWIPSVSGAGHRGAARPRDSCS
jgi:hypothetical protein